MMVVNNVPFKESCSALMMSIREFSRECMLKPSKDRLRSCKNNKGDVIRPCHSALNVFYADEVLFTWYQQFWKLFTCTSFCLNLNISNSKNADDISHPTRPNLQPGHTLTYRDSHSWALDMYTNKWIHQGSLRLQTQRKEVILFVCFLAKGPMLHNPKIYMESVVTWFRVPS